MRNKGIVWIVAIVATLTMACGDEQAQEETNEDQQARTGINAPTGSTGSDRANAASSDMPDATPIQLTGVLNDRGMALTQDSEADADSCDHFEQYGLFGLPLGSACTLGPIVEDVLYGENPDANNNDVVSCNDFDPDADNSGILFALLCDEGVRSVDRLEAARWTDDNETDVALSFLDFDPRDEFDVVGSWTATGVVGGRYPANVSLFSGPVDGELKPLAAMNLVDAINGKLYLDLDEDDAKLKAEFAYSGKVDTSNCRTAPSKETCHWQDISVAGSTDPDAEMFPPMELSVLADGKGEPTIVIIEGKMQMSEALAAAWFSVDDVHENFRNTRSIYFRTVAKDGQAWGSFTFRDENGALIQAEQDGLDLAKFVRDGTGQEGDGYCINVGSEDPALCTIVNRDDYSALWRGEDAMVNLPADYELPLEFPAVPSEYGIFTAE